MRCRSWKRERRKSHWSGNSSRIKVIFDGTFDKLLYYFARTSSKSIIVSCLIGKKAQKWKERKTIICHHAFLILPIRPLKTFSASDVDAHSCDDKRDGKWEKSQNDSNYSSINHSKRRRGFFCCYSDELLLPLDVQFNAQLDSITYRQFIISHQTHNGGSSRKSEGCKISVEIPIISFSTVVVSLWRGSSFFNTFSIKNSKVRFSFG